MCMTTAAGRAGRSETARALDGKTPLAHLTIVALMGCLLAACGDGGTVSGPSVSSGDPTGSWRVTSHSGPTWFAEILTCGETGEVDEIRAYYAEELEESISWVYGGFGTFASDGTYEETGGSRMKWRVSGGELIMDSFPMLWETEPDTSSDPVHLDYDLSADELELRFSIEAFADKAELSDADRQLLNSCFDEKESLQITLEKLGEGPFRYPGSLYIVESTLESLEVLRNITGIDGDLSIYRNEDLRSLEGCHSLGDVTGDVAIQWNTRLSSVRGLESLQSIGGDLRVGFGSLVSFEGFSSLVEIGGDLSIGQITIKSLRGLEGLTNVGGSVYISETYDLQDLSGLDGLEGIGGTLGLNTNYSLLSLAGLERLTTVDGELRIVRNRKLPSEMANALADSLVSAGFVGAIVIEGNG